MAIVCLFGLILGISAIYAELGAKKVEVSLPLAIGSMVVVLYIAGLAGALRAGVWIVMTLGVAAGFSAIILAIVRRHVLRLLKSIFTPGMAIYFVLCAAVCVANAGKPVKTWDEFTYWADAVKIMTQLRTLPTDPAAHSLYASYPPALPLWQYLLQEINGVLVGDMVYTESMLFMSYQWFMLALYIPFTAHLSWRRPVELAVSGIMIPLAALAVFPQAFNQLHSDTLLGVMGGFVCAFAFFHPQMKGFELATQIVMLFVLVLTKDAGILFAVAGVVTMMLKGRNEHRTLTQRILPVIFCLAAVAVARVSWSLHVAATGATAQETFNNPISLAILLDPAQHWRITTLRNFIYKFFEMMVPVQGTTISISYFMMFVILAAGFLTLSVGLKNKEDALAVQRLSVVIFGASVAYLIGTGLTYVFKFYEDEAVRMASYERYLNIVTLFAAFVLFVCFLQMRFPAWKQGVPRRITVGALAVFMLFAPFQALLNAVSRLDAQAAYQSQETYLALEEKVLSVAEPDDKIYLIAAGSGGFERVVMRYRLRPLYVGDDPWNIGVDVGEDRFATQRTIDEFRQCLVESYDLLVICALTEDFSQTYAVLFEEPETLAEGRIYRVNQETGLLELVA